jgi:hypothetical protein
MTATVDAATPEPAETERRDEGELLSMPVRVMLASLSLAAGVIHLVMVPSHAQAGTLDGVGFAVVGWFQVLIAIGLLVRPTRLLLQATVIGNLVIAGLWLWSRTSGLPFGAHAGEAEEAAFVDGFVTVLELGLIVGAAILLVRPALGTRVRGDAMVFASIVPVVVLVATTMALADQETVSHGHGDGAAEMADGGHAHGSGAEGAGHASADMASIAAERCDLGMNPASYWHETNVAQVDTIMGGSHGDDHGAASAPTVKGSKELDELIKLSTAGGEGNDARVVVELSKVNDDVYNDWLSYLPTLAASHGHGEAGAPDDNHGMGGHLGPQQWVAMTDQAECDQLNSEIELARATAMSMPTAQDAMDAGYVRVTTYVPGIAAHYMKFSYVDGTFEIDKPEMVLYDGDGPEASVVGLSYYIMFDSELEPTQGFTGSNDHYHRHDGLCIGAGGVIGDSTTSAEDCAARGGRKSSGGGGWMSHAWVVPGCESPWGVFSGATPVLDRTLAENSGKDGGACKGSGVYDRYDLSPGTVENTPTTVGGQIEVASGG